MQLSTIVKICPFSLTALASSVISQAAPASVANGIQYVDANTRGVQTHGGGVTKASSHYHWFGESGHGIPLIQWNWNGGFQQRWSLQ